VNTGEETMNKIPDFGLVERAQALAPLIASEADEIERTRRLTQPVVSGLIMNMLEQVAMADASTAWCLGQCSVCAMTAAYLDPETAREIFGPANGILAWGAIAGEVQAVPGGYRAHGRWNFASGSRQAAWLGAHVGVIEADGSKRRKADGTPEIRTILFPLASATMYDVWDVIGLKGTGTDSYSVDNLFVPERFSAVRDDAVTVREKGPLYQLTTNIVFGMGFASVALGVARATLDAATDLARGKTPQGIKAMRENNAVQGALGRTEGSLRAARAYLHATAGEVWRELTKTGKYTEAHRVALRLASTWTIHQAASVVDAAYHMAGATAVFAANKFERRFRDMHAIAQQIQARDTHYEDVGRAILATAPAVGSNIN
jgi:alkylation response protein AidB-like acyl-CoA dehydrogenase